MPTPLTNDRWGYASNCFVCEQANASGLRIPFQLDDDQATVSASFTLGGEYSGAPALLHGGISLAILDEAQAWACIAVAGKWGLTRTTQASFDAAVFVDAPHRVEARIVPAAVDAAEELVHTVASILDDRGAVLVSSQTAFFVVGNVDEEQADAGLSTRHRRLLGE